MVSTPNVRPGQRFNPYRQFYGVHIPLQIVGHEALTPAAKILYGVLARYAGKTGRAFPSQRKLASDLGVSSRHIQKLIRELSEARLIEIRTNFDEHGRQTTNSITFLWHEIFLPAEPSEGEGELQFRDEPQFGGEDEPEIPPEGELQFGDGDEPQFVQRDSKEGSQRKSNQKEERSHTLDSPERFQDALRALTDEHPGSVNPQLTAQYLAQRTSEGHALADILAKHREAQQVWKSGRIPPDLHNWLARYDPRNKLAAFEKEKPKSALARVREKREASNAN